MKSITIRQPWARAIAIGRKTIENRGLPTSYRGMVAIHAGKTVDRGGDRDPRIIALFGRDASIGVPLGAIIAVANLVDCHQARWTPDRQSGACCHPWGEPEYATKAGSAPAYHLVLADAVLLPTPVPARGSLAVPFTLPADMAAAVAAQLKEH